MAKQTFNTIDVLYDDKKWGKRIDPDEWNSNFKILEEGHNELVEKLTTQVDAIESAIDNRYTKNEADSVVGENTNDLVKSITYSPTNGTFTITKKSGEVITIDTVIEKVPASMVLKEEVDGTVYLVITNQDGSSTRTNVTSLIEDTIINSSNTINAIAVTDGINKKTTYTLEIKQNSIALKHLNSEAVAKLDDAIEAADIATDAKNIVVNNTTTSTTKANEAAQSAASAQEFANQARNSKVAAQAAQVAAEKARDEAQGFVGGDYVTTEEMEAYVNEIMTVDEGTEV